MKYTTNACTKGKALSSSGTMGLEKHYFTNTAVSFRWKSSTDAKTNRFQAQNLKIPHKTLQGEKSNSSVEKSGGHSLKQVISHWANTCLLIWDNERHHSVLFPKQTYGLSLTRICWRLQMSMWLTPSLAAPSKRKVMEVTDRDHPRWKEPKETQ